MDLTKIEEQLASIAEFYSSFSQKILDPSSEIASKQVFFLDVQSTMKQHLSFLKEVSSEESFPEQTRKDAELLFNKFQKTTEKFRNSLMTSPDISEEDTVASLNETTLKEAAQNNQSTKKLVNDIDNLQKQQANDAALGFNYALVMDGQTSYFLAKDKQEAANFIATEVAAKNPKSVGAYEVVFKPLKLTTKTIVTLE